MATGDVVTEFVNLRAFGCAVFDGVDDKIEFVSEVPMSDYSEYSISFWIIIRDLETGYQVIIADSSQDYGKGGISYQPGEIVYRETVAEGSATADAVIDDSGVWQHVIITHDADGEVNIYIENTLKVTRTGFGKHEGYNGFGKLSGTHNKHFKGGLQDVRIFDVVLTSEERAKVYAGKEVTRGLKHEWKLQDNYCDCVGGYDGTNDGTRLSTIDDALSSLVKAGRTTANDTFLFSEGVDGQIYTAIIEGA
jgi:hypothetical protein